MRFHRYYIADLLTIFEVILTGVIGYLIFRPEISTGIGSFVLLVAELCDAFDGIAARTWRYPDEPERFPWRKYATLYDILSDLLLTLVAALYIVFVVLPKSTPMMATIFWAIAIVFTTIAVVVEIITAVLARSGQRELADAIAVWRRRLVYIPAIGILLEWPLVVSGWPRAVITIMTMEYVMIGILLLGIKRDRWNERFTK